jgi:hypothetical protein
MSAVSESMTADAAANAIDKMLAGDTGEQESDEALVDDEQEVVDEQVEDSEEDAEDDTEESEDDDEQPPEPTKYTVKVDGKDVEVTLDELQKGYSRTEDYTRKTQQLAQERKTAQAEFEAVRAERQQYSQLLTALQQQLAQQDQGISEEQLAALYETDPIEWVRQTEAKRVRQEKAYAIQAEQQRLAQAQQAELQQHQKQHLEQQRELLLAAAPELKDQAKAAEAKKAWIEAGKAIGLTDTELNSITDHRMLLALRKLAAYDALSAKRQAIQPAPKVAPAKPGQATEGKAKVNSTVLKQAQQRLQKSGSVKDAASLLSRLI